MLSHVLIGLFGGLGVFLFGMQMMSQGLQKVAGGRMRAILARATQNRVMGVVTGLTVTSVVQSSSATTVMMVSFVSAGLLTLMQATGIIMGANIGTTMTAWLVSLLGFKIKIAAFALPAVGLGFFVRFLKREALTNWGEVLIGFGLLFLGLEFLKDALPAVDESPALAAWLHRFAADSYWTRWAVIGVGTAITIVVQSSSAVMAITLAAAANGLVDYPTACALVLGENIGTTITAVIAALGASRNALRAALIHVLFNVFGVLWVSFAFVPFVGLVDLLMPGAVSDAAAIPNHLALFHTLFNVSNTLLLLPVAGLLPIIVTRLLPPGQAAAVEQAAGVGSPAPEPLEEMDSAVVSAPTLAIAQARRLTARLVDTVSTMLAGAMATVRGAEELELGAARTHALEAVIDRDEHAINDYLIRVARGSLSGALSREVSLLIQVVNELERIGDHCERLVRLAGRGRASAAQPSAPALAELGGFASQVAELLPLVQRGLDGANGVVTREARERMRAIEEAKRTAYRQHLLRVRGGVCAPAAALIYQEQLDRLEEIAVHGLRAVTAACGKND